jgi:hypothetical protein
MIYCVWYPSGGFGHFVNAVLTLHGQNFVRPKKSLIFSAAGDSHNLDLVVPKYFKNSWTNTIDFDESKNYSVLIDNGIDDESTQFKSKLSNATTIKICYLDHSWPVVAHAMIEKAMCSNIEIQLPTNDNWSSKEPWAKREKYFLFLRNHVFRHAWRPDNESLSIEVSNIYLDYHIFFEKINCIVKTEHFTDTWFNWRKANSRYIDPVITAASILSCVESKISKDLTHIDDLWTQSVIYYYIWLKYKIEVPHNNFADFFKNTDQILELVA